MIQARSPRWIFELHFAGLVAGATRYIPDDRAAIRVIPVRQCVNDKLAAVPGIAEACCCSHTIRDRKSVVSGKSVSVRVDLAGRRLITKKTHDILKTSKIHNIQVK